MIANFLKNVIDRRVDERIGQVLNGTGDFHFIELDDKNAEKIIADFILEQKDKNNTELSTYDFVSNLRLPASQVDSILGKFKMENLVKEVQHA